MTRKIYKADRTRLFIIESMAEVFNKKGYAGTSMADAEAITGLSRGGIYAHFENKEVMALAVFDYNLAKLCSAIQNRIRKAYNAHDKLMVYARVYKTLAEDNFVLGGSPILNTGSEADDTNTLLKERVVAASYKWQQCMILFIEEGKQSGDFKPDVNASQMAFSILSLIEGGLLLARVANDQSRMEQILCAADQMIQANMVHSNVSDL
jgi:TetR/AcrR family transcriptional repressor of nem operon